MESHKTPSTQSEIPTQLERSLPFDLQPLNIESSPSSASLQSPARSTSQHSRQSFSWGSPRSTSQPLSPFSSRTTKQSISTPAKLRSSSAHGRERELSGSLLSPRARSMSAQGRDQNVVRSSFKGVSLEVLGERANLSNIDGNSWSLNASTREILSQSQLWSPNLCSIQENIPTPATEAIALTKTDRDICEKNGILLNEALFYKKVALQLKLNIEFRGGILYRKTAGGFGRKPLHIKTKTKKTPGFTKGFIVARNNESFVKSNIYQTEIYISLEEILAEPCEYRFVQEKENYLTFAPLGPVEEEQDIVYGIDLTDHRKCLKNTSPLAKETTPPYWWSKTMGDFHEASQYIYPAKYSISGGAFKTDLVYGTQKPNGIMHPIIGDNDLYAISVPPYTLNQLDKSLALKKVDCAAAGGVQDMLNKLINLEETYLQKPCTQSEKQGLTDAFAKIIAATGNLTPFEFKIISSINALITNETSERPLQHGPETGNEKYPQAVTKTVIFKWNGDVLLMQDEEALVKWRQAQLKEPAEVIQFYPVNPNCKMPVWKDYIADQILQDLPVDERVKENFMDHVSKLLDTKKSSASSAAAASSKTPSNELIGENVVRAWEKIHQNAALSPQSAASDDCGNFFSRQETKSASTLTPVKKCSASSPMSKPSTPKCRQPLSFFPKNAADSPKTQSTSLMSPVKQKNS